VADWDRRQDLLTLRGKTGMRVVPISPSTGEAMARYLRARSSHPAAKSDALWLGGKGPLRDSGVSQLLARRCRQAGLRRLHPHRFRHTFSHQFRAQGGDPVDLMYLAGWKSLAMTERYGESAAAERARESPPPHRARRPAMSATMLICGAKGCGRPCGTAPPRQLRTGRRW
jgi:integrase